MSVSTSKAKMAGIAAAVAAAGAMGIFWLQRSRRKRRPALRRNMSFTSAYLAMGTYPEKANFSEPIINGAMYFDVCPTEDEIVEQAIKPMLAYDRLSMIPVQDKEGNLRMPSPPLDPRKLVRRMTLSSTQEMYLQIQQVFQDLLGNNPNREDLPWWEFLILENTGEGPSMVVFRIHHALGDGISIFTLMVRHIFKAADGSALSDISSFLPRGMMRKKSSLLEDYKSQFTWFQRFRKVSDAVAKVFLLPITKFDDPTVFSKASCQPDLVYNGKREIVLFPTIPLSFFKEMKTAANVTVNDVLFTCISQAIHDYLKQENCPVLKGLGAQLQCRALLAAALPRSIAKATADDLLQNKFYLLSSDMSVGCSDVLERLQKIHDTFQDLKTSPLAHVGMTIQNTVLKHFPLSVNRMGVFHAMVRHSMTVSNVPGPTQPVLFCGKKIEGGHMFFSNLCPQFGIVSYAGQVYANLTVDPEGVPNCQSLAEFYRQAMIKLAQRLEVQVPPELG